MVGTVIVSYIRLWHWWYLMWTKYSYVCADCDALIEITSQYEPALDPVCICSHDTWVTRTAVAPDEDVTTITYVDVVKINTNPYTL